MVVVVRSRATRRASTAEGASNYSAFRKWQSRPSSLVGRGDAFHAPSIIAASSILHALSGISNVLCTAGVMWGGKVISMRTGAGCNSSRRELIKMLHTGVCDGDGRLGIIPDEGMNRYL